jgi:hypothetical protein
MVTGRGVSMTSVKAPVGGKELTDSGVRRLREMLKQKSMAEPMAEFDKYVVRARSRLDMAKPEVEKAKAFIASSEQREDLDAQSLHAETVSARMIVSLFDTLETLYDKSCEGQSTYPLKCVSVAANTLSAYLKRGHITSAGEYPDSDPLLTGRIVDSRVGTAKEIQNNVAAALDGSLEKFNLSLPELPSAAELVH